MSLSGLLEHLAYGLGVILYISLVKEADFLVELGKLSSDDALPDLLGLGSELLVALDLLAEDSELLLLILLVDSLLIEELRLVCRCVEREVVRKLLDIDTGLGGFHYIGSEVNVSRPMTIRLNDGTDINLRLGGNIDRIDYVTGRQPAAGSRLRVIDYKTGASKATAKDLGTIFARDEKHSGYHLQTLLYASIISDLTGGKVAVSPALLYIQKQRRDESPALKIGRNEVNDIRTIKREVDDGIASIVTDIFCGTDDYTQTDDESRCAYCDFKALCGR